MLPQYISRLNPGARWTPSHQCEPARCHCWRSEIFWMTCCTTSRPRAQLSASSVYRFTGTQNASFFSSVTRQVQITAAALRMSKNRILRSREKSREHTERLVWVASLEAFFLSAGRRNVGLFYWYSVTLHVHLVFKFSYGEILESSHVIGEATWQRFTLSWLHVSSCYKLASTVIFKPICGVYHSTYTKSKEIDLNTVFEDQTPSGTHWWHFYF